MADFGNADDKVPRTVDNLAIRTNQDLDNFWRAILPQFLDVVDPDSDGTLNQLYEDFALTDTDRESLVAAEKDNVPRKKRARRLFSILSTLGLEVFLSSVAPTMCSNYGFIIPERFFIRPEASHVTPVSATLEDQDSCLRHCVQRRVRCERIADMLYHLHCLSPEVYWEITSKPEYKWDTLFAAFARHPPHNTDQLEEKTREILCRYHVPIPNNFADVMSRGFPCTCLYLTSVPSNHHIDPDEKVQKWLDTQAPVNHHPSSESSIPDVRSYYSPISSPRADSECDSVTSEEVFATVKNRVLEQPTASRQILPASQTGNAIGPSKHLASTTAFAEGGNTIKVQCCSVFEVTFSMKETASQKLQKYFSEHTPVEAHSNKLPFNDTLRIFDEQVGAESSSELKSPRESIPVMKHNPLSNTSAGATHTRARINCFVQGSTEPVNAALNTVIKEKAKSFLCSVRFILFVLHASNYMVFTCAMLAEIIPSPSLESFGMFLALVVTTEVCAVSVAIMWKIIVWMCFRKARGICRCSRLGSSRRSARSRKTTSVIHMLKNLMEKIFWMLMVSSEVALLVLYILFMAFIHALILSVYFKGNAVVDTIVCVTGYTAVCVYFVKTVIILALVVRRILHWARVLLSCGMNRL